MITEIPTKGRFLNKQKWISICSKHQTHDTECNLCNCGYWSNVWYGKMSGWVFDHYPKFWIWIMNTRFGKRYL